MWGICTCVDVMWEVRTESPSLGLLSDAPLITGDLTFSKNNPEEGEATTASCMWSGDPPPTVQWFKDGRLLVEFELPSHVRITPVSSGMGSKLEILEAELDDTGDYTCNVSSPVGFDFQVNRLEVQGDTHVPECYLHGSNYMHISVTFTLISWCASFSTTAPTTSKFSIMLLIFPTCTPLSVFS